MTLPFVFGRASHLRGTLPVAALAISLALGAFACDGSDSAASTQPAPGDDDGDDDEDDEQDREVDGRDDHDAGAAIDAARRDGAVNDMRPRDGDGGASQPARRDSGTTDGGASSASDADSGMGATGPTECNGKALPPRARGKRPPFAVGPESAGLPVYWPTEGFRSETPTKLGFDEAKLMRAVEYQTPYSSTQAVLVVRHGYLAAERYFAGFTAQRQHESYSVAKSFTSALIGIAIAEGKLTSTDDKVCAAYPMQWNCADASDGRSRITVDHALNLTTGLMWREDWRSTATGPNDAYALNLLDSALSKRTVEEPGTNKRYSTGDPALLSGVLQRATGMTVLAYAKQKIFDVIGTPGIRWNSDSKGRTTSHAGMQATATEYAKFGYLYLRRGKWADAQVVPEAWVDRTTRAEDPCTEWNRYLWHINPPIRLGAQDPACPGLFCQPTEFADLPPDAYFAEGVNGQFIFVVPSSDLVIVRLANDMPGSERWDEYAAGFLAAVLDAIVK